MDLWLGPVGPQHKSSYVAEEEQGGMYWSIPSLAHAPITNDNPPTKWRKKLRRCGRTIKGAWQKGWSAISNIATIDPALDPDQPAVEAPTNNHRAYIYVAPAGISISATNKQTQA